MVFFSAGSNPSGMTIDVSVTKLTHKICTGSSGVLMPISSAPIMVISLSAGDTHVKELPCGSSYGIRRDKDCCKPSERHVAQVRPEHTQCTAEHCELDHDKKHRGNLLHHVSSPFKEEAFHSKQGLFHPRQLWVKANIIYITLE